MPARNPARLVVNANLVDMASAARTDNDALARLVSATSTRVWRTCASLVDSASADDLTQETYLRAARSLRSFRGDSSPVPWLITIARRVCADEISSRQRRREVDARLRRQRSDPAPDPTVMAEVCDAITALVPQRREAFLLTAVAGLSYADAATACRCPVGTIRSRVARARADLARALGDAACDEPKPMPPTAERDRLNPNPGVRTMNHRPTTAAMALLAVGALTLTGCSSDGEPAPSTARSSVASTDAPAGTAHADLGELHISGGYIPQPASPDVAAAYFTVTNDGSSADTLTKVTTDVTSDVMAMDEAQHDGSGSMTDLSKVTVPAHGSFRFMPRKAHLMLQKPNRPLKDGQKVSMTITFTRAGTVRLDLPVVPISGPTGTPGPTQDMSGMNHDG